MKKIPSIDDAPDLYNPESLFNFNLKRISAASDEVYKIAGFHSRMYDLLKSVTNWIAHKNRNPDHDDPLGLKVGPMAIRMLGMLNSFDINRMKNFALFEKSLNFAEEAKKLKFKFWGYLSSYHLMSLALALIAPFFLGEMILEKYLKIFFPDTVITVIVWIVMYLIGILVLSPTLEENRRSEFLRLYRDSENIIREYDLSEFESEIVNVKRELMSLNEECMEFTSGLTMPPPSKYELALK